MCRLAGSVQRRHLWQAHAQICQFCSSAMGGLQALQAILMRQAHVQAIKRAAETGHAHDAHWRAASPLQNAPVRRLAVGGHLELLGELRHVCSCTGQHGAHLREMPSKAASKAAQLPQQQQTAWSLLGQFEYS